MLIKAWDLFSRVWNGSSEHGYSTGIYVVYVGAILALGGSLFAAIIGTGILSKEEGGHTAEFLYTLPYNRINVVLQKMAVIFVIVFAFDLVNLFLGLLSFPLIHADIA